MDHFSSVVDRMQMCIRDSSYDNAMAESINGLYKAEVIHRKSWKNRTRRLSTVWQILKFLRE